MVLQWVLVRSLAIYSVEASTGEAREAPPVVVQTTRNRIRWIGPLGASGIAFAALGVSGITVGTVLIRRGLTTEPHPTNDQLSIVKDYARPGWTLYGVGFGLTAIGAVALAVDVTVGRERRYRRRIALHPQLGHAHAGLQIRGSF
jgi:hypothetical protein